MDFVKCLIYKTTMTSRFLPSFGLVLIAHLVLILGSWQLFTNDEVVTKIKEGIKTIRVQLASEKFMAKPILTSRPEAAPQKKTVTTPKPKVEESTPVVPLQEVVATSAAEQGEIADAKTAFKNELRAKIEENKYYPPMSRRLGHTGIVTVAFTLLDDGHIINIRLDTPSRHELLNESALTAVKKVHKFKPIPREWGMDRMDIKVPIKFYTI